MDLFSVFGFLLGSAFLIVGIKLGGSLPAFFDLPSIMVVFGGTFGASCLAYSYDRVRDAIRMMFRCLKKPPEYNFPKIVGEILAISDLARKEGILSLDSQIDEVENPLLLRGLQMVIDGIDVALIENVLTTEIGARSNRHSDIKATIELFASLAPAFGLIGTIIGLVGLLKNLNDPTSIGPNMALALITTFYGAVFANLVCIPLSKKVEERSQKELLYGELILRGCILIGSGIHPRIVEDRLLAYLSESQRSNFSIFKIG